MKCSKHSANQRLLCNAHRQLQYYVQYTQQQLQQRQQQQQLSQVLLDTL
jgi:hypothetical protein